MVKKTLSDIVSIEDGLLNVKEDRKKKDQIIIRLSAETKDKLQKVADDLDIDMSKLIRNKIDEIIEEHELLKNNKRIVNEKNEFIKAQEFLSNKIIDKTLVEEVREEFKKRLIEKMQKEINEVSLVENLIYNDSNKM